MTTRSALVRRITADEGVQLLLWFAESYDEGWRPVMESHVAGKSGRYTPVGVDALREKVREIVDQLAELDDDGSGRAHRRVDGAGNRGRKGASGDEKR